MGAFAVSDAVVEILIYLGLIVGASGVLAAVWLVLRSRLGRGERDASLGAGFTLQDVDEMHARGQLTEEQYHNIRRRIAARSSESLHARGPAAEDGNSSERTGLSES